MEDDSLVTWLGEVAPGREILSLDWEPEVSPNGLIFRRTVPAAATVAWRRKDLRFVAMSTICGGSGAVPGSNFLAIACAGAAITAPRGVGWYRADWIRVGRPPPWAQLNADNVFVAPGVVATFVAESQWYRLTSVSDWLIDVVHARRPTGDFLAAVHTPGHLVEAVDAAVAMG